MITQYTPIPGLLGLITNVDPSQVPLGGLINGQNMAQLNPGTGRVRRIAGVSVATAPNVDASAQVPLAFWAKGLGAGGADQLIAVFVGASTVSIVNLSTGLALSGPALAAPSFGVPWSATFYNQKYIIAGGNNTSIYQIDNATTYSALTGTPTPPGGNLVQSFFDRLYISDIAGDEGLVAYSDVLTTDFPAVNVVNVKEIPGKVTALAINSPTTDAEGIQTQLIICKQNAMWKYDETSKDLVSGVHGSLANASFVNTEAGLVFAGQKGDQVSVFYLPIGHEGEPLDIGEVLQNLLTGDTKADNLHLAHAALHKGFYKLFYSLTGENDNPNEVWLDTYRLSTQRQALWYGPHTRGSFDASVVEDDRLNLFVRGAAGAQVRFRENESADSDFTAADGSTLEAVLDLPLNVNPQGEEKQFDVLELQIPSEANISGNSITYEPIAEGASQGAATLSIFTDGVEGISRIQVPVRSPGFYGMAARDARIKLTHSLNQRFDILGAAIQYLYHEGRSRVRT